MKIKTITFTMLLALFIIVPSYAFADIIGDNNDQNNNQGTINNGGVAGDQTNATASTASGAEASIVDSFNSEPGDPTVIPGDVNFPSVMAYTGKARPSAAFQDVRIALMYGNWFSEDALLSALKGRQGTWSDFKVINGQLDPAPADEDGVRWIKIVINNSEPNEKGNVYPLPVPGVDIAVGQGAAEAQDKKDLMIEVIADLALDALQKGCNVLQITDQGFVNDAFGKTAGIGGQTTQLVGGELLNSSSFALGYSTSKSGSRSLPWIQAQGLIDYELGFPPKRARAYSGETRPSYDYTKTSIK